MSSVTWHLLETLHLLSVPLFCRRPMGSGTDKKLQCKYCHKFFLGSRSNLRRHIISKHETHKQVKSFMKKIHFYLHVLCMHLHIELLNYIELFITKQILWKSTSNENVAQFKDSKVLFLYQLKGVRSQWITDTSHG